MVGVLDGGGKEVASVLAVCDSTKLHPAMFSKTLPRSLDPRSSQGTSPTAPIRVPIFTLNQGQLPVSKRRIEKTIEEPGDGRVVTGGYPAKCGGPVFFEGVRRLRSGGGTVGSYPFRRVPVGLPVVGSVPAECLSIESPMPH